ncbi:laccase domain protein [Effusibacillus dendaii]|uniref:Purine nucleoside phosphorylase n=2 Tax=Effusibacillus dendaii TaxID=2743772 RepID=A0A7I8DC22_9BACL|nr:laccase domain protein [Effusibacillus dendaii]
MKPIPLIEAPSINQTGIARGCFTTRLGGVSTGVWDSLNLGLHVGDERENVVANRTLVAEQLDVPLEMWVCGEQVHGNRVTVVEQDDKGKGAYFYEQSLPGTDALVSHQPGLMLATFAADCVPMLLLDPVNTVIAAVHAGWKGTVKQVAGEAVKTMGERFGSRPQDILAAIGPSIDRCCYEVDQQVFLPFIEEFSGGERFFTANERHRWQLSLPEANRQILIDSGLLPEHIERVGGCTACDTETYFSHRAENGKTGRLAGLIVLR